MVRVSNGKNGSYRFSCLGKRRTAARRQVVQLFVRQRLTVSRGERIFTEQKIAITQADWRAA
jgi:hypothetical protein